MKNVNLFAVVRIGDAKFALPLSDATRVVELLGKAERVQEVRYSLSSLDPTLQGQYVVAKPDYFSRVELTVGVQEPLPFFDQEQRIAELEAARDEAARNLAAAREVSELDSIVRACEGPAH